MTLRYDTAGWVPRERWPNRKCLTRHSPTAHDARGSGDAGAQRVGRATTPGVALTELTEDWLAAKQATESVEQTKKGNSDRARRGDLARWANLLTLVLGRDGPVEATPPLARLTLADLTAENVLRALAAGKARYSEATLARMLSHLRSFARWLQAAWHLDADPFEHDVLRARPSSERRPRALAPEAVERLIADASLPTTEGRMWWPDRDVAVVRFMATTGARAEELCEVRIEDIDRRAERPIWRVNHSKGGRRRNVTLPRLAVDALDVYLVERARTDERRPALTDDARERLFVRVDGQRFTVNVLDRLLRQLAIRSNVSLPEGAAAHALRHHYGVTLALRGVPQSVIAQLMGHADPRTTSIYTTVGGQELIGVLDDAGLL
jgi:site-specific recombinase XerD